MTGARRHKKRKQSRTKAEIQHWRDLMSENKWSPNKLAMQLGLAATVVNNWLAKDEAGEIDE